MPKPISIGHIPVCAGQAFAFALAIQGAAADASALTNMVLVGQIRKGATPATPLVTPTITVSAPVVTSTTATVTATISVTEAQSASLPSTEPTFATATTYVINIEGAYSDAPTIEALRFVGYIDVYQGGIVVEV